MGKDYIRDHAQELDDEVTCRHIDLYVNEFSRDIGETGTKAVTAFFDYAGKAGLIKLSPLPLFAC